MPYKRRKYSRKKAVSRIQRAWRRRKSKFRKKSVQRQLTKLKKVVYADKQEGWIDTVSTAISIFDNGAVWLNRFGLDAIAEGTGHDQRTGNKIAVKSMHLRGRFQINGDNDNKAVRMIIVKVPDDGNTALLVSQILESPISYRSFYKKNSSRKYSIVFDKTYILQQFFQLTGAACSTTYPQFRDINIKLFCKNLPLHYRSSSVGDPQTNNYQLILISDHPVGTIDPPTLEALSVRTHFDR